MKKPIAVLISDVHYNINTLEVADKAVTLAITKAEDFGVPLIVAGDLHDTKANLRAECVNAMIKTFALCVQNLPLILVGNHDKINEKSEYNSLNFLEEYVNFIVDNPRKFDISIDSIIVPYPVYIIPYQHDVEQLRAYLKTIPKGSTIIMHQGVNGSNSGEYIQDRTALNKEDLAGFRVISGHYHQRQSFDLPDGGRFDYIGNPYTLNFGEANDPDKGFQILYNDGSLEFVPTNLRKHVIYESEADFDCFNRLSAFAYHNDNDIIWIKIKGSSDELSKITKIAVKECMGLVQDFRLDLIPTETNIQSLPEAPENQLDILDAAIDSLTNTSEERKARLKQLYKDLI